MMKRIRKSGTTLNALTIFYLIVWATMSLAGCGGGGNIPSASVLSSGSVALSWNRVPGAASYNVYLATSPEVTPLNSFKISNVTNSITITDLEPGTTYYFVVAVEDDSGASRQSKEVSYTVGESAGQIDLGDIININQPEPAGTNASPEAASAAAASAAKSTHKTERDQASQGAYQETRDVTLSWDNVPNSTSYNIYWSDKAGVTRQSGTKISNVKNPYKMSGLKKGKKYYFVVTAVNASGESPESAEFSFTVGK